MFNEMHQTKLPSQAEQDNRHQKELLLYPHTHRILPKQTGIRNRAYRTIILVLIALALITATTLGGVSIFNSSNSQIWTSCGDNLQTAYDRNCAFDLISFAWQLPECYDAPLVAEFTTWNNWTFYADNKLTDIVPRELVLRGSQSPLYVEWDYHMVHCTFMWRQMHRAYKRGWIDSHLDNYNHTLHCQKMILMDAATAERSFTIAQVIYPDCQRTMP